MNFCKDCNPWHDHTNNDPCTCECVDPTYWERIQAAHEKAVNFEYDTSKYIMVRK